MTKRRKGAGTIEPTRDGRFRPRLPFGKRERLDPCDTREDAQAVLDAALAEIAAGNATPIGGVTLKSFGEEFLELRERQGGRNTATDKSRWETHIETAVFFDWPVRAIAPADVRTWLDGMFQKHAAPGFGHKKPRAPRRLSRRTIQNTLNLLRVCLQAAADRGIADTNAAKDVRLPRSSGETHEPWTYLLPEEQKTLMMCEAIPEADRLLIAFALGTGMREGEVWNLEVGDVQLEQSRVVVRYGSRKGATKGGRIRRIPLFGLARAAAVRQLALLEGAPNGLGLLWPLPSGARRQKGEPDDWAAWRTAAGLAPEKRHDGRHVRWHDLRHTCASSLVAGWWGRPWRLEEVKELLGHRSIATTERYAHLAASALDQAARETELAAISRPTHAHAPEPPAAQVHGLLESRPGDLNPGPTVYEGLPFLSSRAALSPAVALAVGVSECARAALDAIAAGGPEAWRLATEALEAIADLADDALTVRVGRRSA